MHPFVRKHNINRKKSAHEDGSFKKILYLCIAALRKGRQTSRSMTL